MLNQSVSIILIANVLSVSVVTIERWFNVYYN